MFDPTSQAPHDVSASQATEPDTTEPANEWDSLQARLATTPHDPERWYRLVEIAEGSGDMSKIQTAYDGLLNAYPNTVRWPHVHTPNDG
jgi:cytochrome c-type biogenesis protein CcmH/NrfG